MNRVLNISKDKIFYWLLVFVAITLPFPSLSLNSKAIIGFFIFWLFYNSFKEKIQLLKENYLIILVISTPFWLSLLGCIYTDNFFEGLKKVMLLLPFLIFPLSLYTVKLKPEALKYVLNCLTAAVIIASLLALSKMVYFKANNLGDYFFYDRFSLFLNIHTTYFSLLTAISFLHILHQWLLKKINPICFLIIAGYFFFLIYILSVRISIIALTVGIIILLLFHIKSKLKWIILPLFSIATIFVFNTPNFEKRFQSSTIDTGQISDIEFRKHHWSAVSETIKNNHWLFGAGTNGNRDFLYQKYKDYELTAAYERNYNAHNQPLETLLDYGWLGTFFLIAAIVTLFSLFLNKKDTLGISILIVFLLFFTTESLLQRHTGVVIFSFLMSLLLIDYKFLYMNLKKTLFYAFIVSLLLYATVHYLNTSSDLSQ